MTAYTPQQINAVRDLADLCNLDKALLTETDCINYLDWWLAEKQRQGVRALDPDDMESKLRSLLGLIEGAAQ